MSFRKTGHSTPTEEGIPLASLDDAEKIAAKALEQERKRMWEKEWHITLGSGEKIVNKDKETRHVTKHAKQQWDEMELARKQQKTSFEALAKVVAIGQFAASHGHKARDPQEQAYYESFSQLTGKKIFNPKLETDTLANRAREFDELVQSERDELEISIQRNELYERIVTEREYLPKITESFTKLDQLAAEAKEQGIAFDQEGLTFLKNTMNRLMQCASIKELNLYIKHFQEVLKQFTSHALPEKLSAAELDKLETLKTQKDKNPEEQIELARLTAVNDKYQLAESMINTATKLEQQLQHYFTAHTVLMNSVGIDAHHDRLYLEALSEIATDMLEPVMGMESVVGSHESLEHIVEPLEKRAEIAKMTKPELSVDRIKPPSQANAEKALEFFEKLKEVISNKKTTLGLHAVGFVLLLTPAAPFAATAMAIKGMRNIGEHTAELTEKTEQIEDRMRRHQAEYSKYSNTKKLEGLMQHSILKSPPTIAEIPAAEVSPKSTKRT